MFNNESLKKGAESLKKINDGEPKNIDPLKQIPEPEMRLYGIHNNYFLTREELISYCEDNEFSKKDAFIIDYLRSVAGRSDVIRKIYQDGRTMLYSAVDRDGYGIYNYQRSVYRGKFTWEFNYGIISEMYVPFRDRGIVFENDVYGKIEESEKKLTKKLEEKINSMRIKK